MVPEILCGYGFGALAVRAAENNRVFAGDVYLFRHGGFSLGSLDDR
jgi:hypothetical protein